MRGEERQMWLRGALEKLTRKEMSRGLTKLLLRLPPIVSQNYRLTLKHIKD